MIRATFGKEGRQVDSVYGLLSDLWFECYTDICVATCSQIQNMFLVSTKKIRVTSMLILVIGIACC